MDYVLDKPLKNFIGTTSKRLELLKEMGIKTVGDLLSYFPRIHEDRSNFRSISGIDLKEINTLKGQMVELRNQRSRFGKFLTRGVFMDEEGGIIDVIWFNQRHIAAMLPKNKKVVLSGKVKLDYGKMVMMSPQFEIVQENLIHTGRLVPVYDQHDKISSKWLREKIRLVLPYVEQFEENLPKEILTKERLIDRIKAVSSVHYPESKKNLKMAKERLAFEELYHLQLKALKRKLEWMGKKAKKIPMDIELIKIFIQSLPFTLTGSQKVSMYEILKDIEKEYPMNRLLEGDVGSGKTVVVVGAMVNAWSQGYQSLIMAPTEILARQHYKTITDVTMEFRKSIESSGKIQNAKFKMQNGKKDIRVELLTGSVTGKKRKNILLNLQLGITDIIVGTHALVEEGLKFKNLGFAVVDEQHRFGVEQREKLKEYDFPHLLNMTATPIPRSLALSAYGDQDLSVIDEMPPERQQVITRVVPFEKRKQVYRFIYDMVKKGRQVYVICPLIDESDFLEVKSAVKEQKFLANNIFPEFTVGLLHGKMTPLEKTFIMNELNEGKIDILVSTSVIEVGIDVKNVSIMLIEGAERFGLAQLHQFRGRVGRGKHQSYCFLFPSKEGESSNERLRAMEKEHCGFRLAEIDLEMRGPGEVYGIRQSGIPDLKMATISDIKMVVRARKAAEKTLGIDGDQ